MIVYVSCADAGEIAVLSLDAERGRLEPVQSVPLGGQPMPLAVSPDRRRLYAALRAPPPAVVTLRIDPADGRLSEVGRSPLPDSMAYLAIDRSGRCLLAASYGGDKLGVSPIDAGGVAGAPAQVVPTGRHAHAALADPSNRWVYVTNLGADAIMRLALDAEHARVVPDTTFAMRPGAGPRHFVFHPAGRHVYLLNELDAQVDVLAFDASSGTLALRQTVATLLPSFEGRPWAADLHLTPDGRFLVTSERTSSTLAVFAVDEQTGTLEPLAHVPTETQPRGFAIDPSGRWLVAAGQLSHAATLYAIDAARGTLTAQQRLPLGQNPNWVEIIDV
jgi:6-phosphogluconolactonase